MNPKIEQYSSFIFGTGQSTFVLGVYNAGLDGRRSFHYEQTSGDDCWDPGTSRYLSTSLRATYVLAGPVIQIVDVIGAFCRFL